MYESSLNVTFGSLCTYKPCILHKSLPICNDAPPQTQVWRNIPKIKEMFQRSTCLRHLPHIVYVWIFWCNC